MKLYFIYTRAKKYKKVREEIQPSAAAGKVRATPKHQNGVLFGVKCTPTQHQIGVKLTQKNLLTPNLVSSIDLV